MEKDGEMRDRYDAKATFRDYRFREDVQNLVQTIISSIFTLASMVSNSNMDSNSIGGITHPFGQVP